MKTENRVQQDIFIWHWNNYPGERGIFFHVPNENQHRKTNIGVVAGVSDMILLKNGTAYLFEVKTEIGKQSPKQLKWQQMIEEKGYKYFIVRNLEEFKLIYGTL